MLRKLKKKLHKIVVLQIDNIIKYINQDFEVDRF